MNHLNQLPTPSSFRGYDVRFSGGGIYLDVKKNGDIFKDACCLVFLAKEKKHKSHPKI